MVVVEKTIIEKDVICRMDSNKQVRYCYDAWLQAVTMIL